MQRRCRVVQRSNSAYSIPRRVIRRCSAGVRATSLHSSIVTKQSCAKRRQSGAATRPTKYAGASSHSITVGGRQQLVGHCQAKHAGGLNVDDQLELARLHHRKFARLGALEKTGIGAGLTPNGNVAIIVWRDGRFTSCTRRLFRSQIAIFCPEEEATRNKYGGCYGFSKKIRRAARR
jgi:hypothetical protein